MKYLAFLLGCLYSTIVFCSADHWIINQDHSDFQFRVGYLGVSEVSGRFKKISGMVILDEKEHPSEILIKVDASSLDTANSLRDGHIRGNDFLQTKHHPEIIFHSKFVSPIGKGQFKAQGLLTIKNVTKDFFAIFTITNSVKDTWGYENKFVKFSATIKRSNFNIKWNKTLADQKYLVSDDVSLFGTLQLQPSTAKTPSTKHMLPDTKYIRHREKVLRGEEAALPKIEPEQGIAAAFPNKIAPGNNNNNSIEDFRKNNWWWAALWTLGLLGFFAVMIIGFYSKNILIDYFPRKYEENGILGYLSDLIVILLVLIYSVAFWFVGWGIR